MLLVGLFAAALVGLALVIMFRRKKRVDRLRWSEIGTIIDRAVRAYRRYLLPLLALSAICAPLGAITYTSVFSFFIDNSARSGLIGTGSLWVEALKRIILGVILVMGSLGLGKTLLACGVAQAIYDEASGQPVSLWRVLSQQRRGATLSLIVRMIIPSLLRAFFGYLGALVTLSWWVAPAAMIYERLGPRDAIKHGRAVVKAVRWQLLDVVVLLWLIGWLIAGAPLLGIFWLLNMVTTLSPATLDSLMLIGWIVGSVFVAPLTALGATHFYVFVRERSLVSVELAQPSMRADEQVAV
jgi:hypothetical protein